jgi:hypothetical protein
MSKFQYILSIPVRHPFIFGVSVTAIKTGTVDVFVQKYIEKAEKLDVRRTTIFTTFGVLYLGAWQYLLFVKIMPKLVPGAATFAAKSLGDKMKDLPGLKGLLIQNFVENGINNPLLYFPIFYTLKEYIEGGKLENGIQKYKDNMYKDVMDIWSLWVPAQFINFAFSPMWFRVPFVACVSALWTGYVSYTRGKPSDTASKELDENIMKTTNTS